MLKVITTKAEALAGEAPTLSATLDDLARDGARRMIAAALQLEVAEYVARFREARDERGHALVVRNGTARVLLKATPFTEDAEGYATLFGMLGAPVDALVAMEATGHYWKNLFAALVAAGFAVALLNPLRTRRFAGEDLQTDSDRRDRCDGDRAVRRAEAAPGQPAARSRDRGPARAGPVP